MLCSNRDFRLAPCMISHTRRRAQCRALLGALMSEELEVALTAALIAVTFVTLILICPK